MFGSARRSVIAMTTFPLTNQPRPNRLRLLAATLRAGLGELRRAQLARLRYEALRHAGLLGSPGHQAAIRVLHDIYGDRLPPRGLK